MPNVKADPTAAARSIKYPRKSLEEGQKESRRSPEEVQKKSRRSPEAPKEVCPGSYPNYPRRSPEASKVLCPDRSPKCGTVGSYPI